MSSLSTENFRVTLVDLTGVDKDLTINAAGVDGLVKALVMTAQTYLRLDQTHTREANLRDLGTISRLVANQYSADNYADMSPAARAQIVNESNRTADVCERLLDALPTVVNIINTPHDERDLTATIDTTGFDGLFCDTDQRNIEDLLFRFMNVAPDADFEVRAI